MKRGAGHRRERHIDAASRLEADYVHEHVVNVDVDVDVIVHALVVGRLSRNGVLGVSVQTKAVASYRPPRTFGNIECLCCAPTW